MSLFVTGGGGDDPEKVAKWEALKKKYGANHLSKRMQWIDWADKALPSGGVPKVLAMNAASRYKLSPGLLLASAMEEGIGTRYPDDKGESADWSEAYFNANQKGELKGYDVDGFRAYGLDSFGGRYEDLVKGGYLPADFSQKFKPYKAKNEKGEWMTTAAFSDDESAMVAKAAIMAQERDKLQGIVKKRNLQLTPEEEKFFTLASYNGGLGNAQAMLDYYAARKLLGGNQFLTHKMAAKGQIYDNIMPRYAGANLFEGEGYFNPPPPKAP
jgi:hypothetical protein